MDANSAALGTSSTQGDDTSIGKNRAPVSRAVRKTSDKTSTDAGVDISDDPSWYSATARSYIRRHGPSNHGGPVAPAHPSVRTIWALGDYHRFATSTVWRLGPLLVKACGISPGQQVLEVATGSGNVAIRAAQAGARVVALDVTPENFGAGRRAAQEAGVDLEWIEGDAEALSPGD